MRYWMFLLVLIFANVASAMDCDVVPTCEELGYSKADDPYCAENGYMYCPLDHSYKKCVNMDCAKLGFSESDKSSWCGKLIKCKGNPRMTLCQNLCEIGDVYYSDGTCGYAQDYDGTKTAVGVVYWVTDDGRHGKVINLHDFGRESETAAFDPKNPYNTKHSSFYWGYSGYDVQSLINYNSDENLLEPLKNRDPDLYDGKGNTDKILADKRSGCRYLDVDYYKYCVPQAAQATRDFYPLEVEANNLMVGQGKWSLPALGELMDLYGYDNNKITDRAGTSGANGYTKNIVNATLVALKGKGVKAEELKDYYWSSTEQASSGAWRVTMGIGYRGTNAKSDSHYVRATLEF